MENQEKENIESEDPKEYLIIKNFGPLKSVKLDLKNSTLFIGPQGSGKSTIAKLIAIFRDYKVLYKDTNLIEFFNKYNIRNYFSNSSNGQNVNTEKSYLEYSCPHYKIIYDNEFTIERNPLFQSVLNNEEQRIESLIKDFSGKQTKGSKINEGQRQRFLEIFKTSKELFSPLFLDLIQDSIYIPAERLLTSIISESPFGFLTSQTSLPKFITDFGSLFEQARKSVLDFKVDFLKIRYKFEQSQNKVFFENKKFIKLSESASGYQSIIPILLVLQYLCKNISYKYSFIIEEPELSLFPTSQKYLIDSLVSKCTKNNNELVITTHSPYVLSSFSNLLFAYQVAKKNPDKEKEVEKIIPKNSWLNPEEFNAYYISEGGAKQIFNKKNDLIGENQLDQVSDIIGDEFDKLMQIYRL